MAAMMLHELLKQAGIAASADNPLITGIAMNSKHVRPGDLFVALGGGNAHIDKAIAAGAVAVLSDAADARATDIPVVFSATAAHDLDALLSEFYPGGFAGLSLFAVTGTNGKTSCAHFLTQALGQDSHCGMIGTLGYGELSQVTYTGYTTPDVCELYRILAQFEAEQVNNIVMEVSSHALEQGRVQGLTYQGAIFTNLTQDHLDYHQTMADYFAAKQKLFTDYAPGFSVINSDDDYGRQLIASLPGRELVVYGCQADMAGHDFVLAQDIHEGSDGLAFAVHSSWGNFQVNSKLFGQYNVYNLLAVAAVLFKLGHAVADVVQRLQALRPVSGRLEDFQVPGLPRVFVDFAHTPDALQQTLSALQNSFHSDIYCVFGCGGDRDQGKRPLMGAVASQYCKRIFITNDNPRSEDPAAIVADIVRGVDDAADYLIEHDRHKAIEMAIHSASERDVVLIAGKGHETTQTIGNQVLPFSDGEVVREVMAA